ncbi:hypothetical protein OZ411_37095 [Bradyrhizobium sp. Arg237L]|uniref:hypothetical protein n=1 Tax=Bradyrhizobium sp. Arg237L TaxID=3003352 RepID=UPI00249ED9F8|nr:hypothetical protein [Bradyrhizobium sp. Arg237L]MDI4238427.1 hypothetical protein [Bradyrhizobium sp. Arg237L]
MKTSSEETYALVAREQRSGRAVETADTLFSDGEYCALGMKLSVYLQAASDPRPVGMNFVCIFNNLKAQNACGGIS